jgi:hypothetical protein
MTQNPADKALAAAAELRTLIRAAHEAAQMLNDAMKAARTQVDEYLHDEVVKALNFYTATMQQEVDGWAADARADARRVADNLKEALTSVCTILEIDMQAQADTPPVRAALVMDLRGKPVLVARLDEPAAPALMRDATHIIRVGSTLRMADEPS